MKIRFWGIICEKSLEKTRFFDYFDEKEPPHENWIFGDVLSKISEKTWIFDSFDEK